MITPGPLKIIILQPKKNPHRLRYIPYRPTHMPKIPPPPPPPDPTLTPSPPLPPNNIRPPQVKLTYGSQLYL